MTTEVIEERDAREAALLEAGQQMVELGEALSAQGWTLGDVFLALDTDGYRRLGDAYGGGLDMPPPAREALIRRSRLYWQQEPTGSRPLKLWTEFAFGLPWTFTAQDAALQRIVDATLDAKANRRVFSRQGWQLSSTKLLVDGERWFAFFTGGTGVRVRTFEPLEIVHVISNPEDRDEPWYYVRRWVDAERKVHVWVYRDWDFVEERPDGSLDYSRPRSDPHPWLRTGDSPIAGTLVGAHDVQLDPQPDVALVALVINTIGERGYPLLTASLDWIREHREFMRDRSSLNKAAAQYALKVAVKGGEKHVEAIKTGVEASNPTTSPATRGPRAGTWVQNAGVDLDSGPERSDGASASHDGRGLRLMALAATGVPEHIWGDVSTGNLATATALEPVLKRQWEAYQGLWMDFALEMIEHLAGWAGYAGDLTVDIDAPPIYERETAEFAQLLGAAVSAYPALRQSTELLSLVLVEMGLNNVDDVVSELEPLLQDQEPEPPPGAPPAATGRRGAIQRARNLQNALEAIREARRAGA